MTTTTAEITDLTGRPAKHDGAVRGKRMSWTAFYKEFPHLRPDNDNRKEEAAA